MISQPWPDWLYKCFSIALLGEIYTEVRVVSFGMSMETAKLKYYLDREPNDFDFASIEVVATNLDAAIPEVIWTALEVDCQRLVGVIADIPSSETIIFARREYDIPN